MDIMDELMLHARRDSWYQQCLAEVNEKEPAFLEIRNSLSEEQQEMLDDYIAACEELEHSLVYIAYQIGALVRSGMGEKHP